jgi:NADH-quinone oxidoreductase subunit J
MQIVLFYTFATLTLIGAIGVVASSNIVRAAVQLLVALLGVAGLYFLLGAEFLAAAQLVIYVGGTLVLIIFGVMLTARASLRLLQPTRTERVLAILSTLILLASLIAAILTARFAQVEPVAHDAYLVRSIGQAMLGDYLLPFELASVLLLAVMIGAAYLAKKRAPIPREGTR